jgi:glycosyltransferase involved in cell wall biosynthesis
MKKVLFLYSELAGYIFSCFQELATREVEVTVIHWPVNPEAPFKIPSIKGVTFISKNELKASGIAMKVKELKPDIILTSGWMDKEYLSIVKEERGIIPTVILFDTAWNGSVKQRVLAAFGKRFLTKRFSHAWVAGKAQKAYAQRLGFKKEHIETGFYTADLIHFNEIFNRRKSRMEQSFPKTFLYVGRYVAQKNMQMLWNAFLTANKANGGQWKLRCIGTGELFDLKTEHPTIEHLGFIQPMEMEDYLIDAGVFVLPSLFEPWGVVVQEFAAAGFPMVLSDKIGASEEFLQLGHNGYDFDSSSELDLTKALALIIQLEESVLIKFAKESHKLAQKLNPQIWTDTLLRLL